MKKIIFVLLSAVVFTACKNNDKSNDTADTEVVSETETESKRYQGDFIYFEDAAVLKGKSFIYGVKLNDKAKELAEQVAQYKEEDYDMVNVLVKGTVTPKPEGADGWDEILTIEEIVHVSTKPTKEDIRIE